VTQSGKHHRRAEAPDHGHGHDEHEHEHEHKHDDERGHDDDHDDKSGHDHDAPSGLLGKLRHLVSPHSHDAAVSVDSELEASRRGMRALLLSFLALLVTALLQVGVVVISGSVALLVDTLHNAADALTALPIAVAFTLGRRAATRRYTYGYGRAEDLAGIVVVLFIAVSAVLAAYEAIRRLADPRELDHLGLVAIAGVIGFLGNELVARYRIKSRSASRKPTRWSACSSPWRSWRSCATRPETSTAG
jgi:Co/Zn/Cd efflux system component